MSKKIQYRYAFDEQENIIDALKLNREKELTKYYCPGCKSKLTPVLGCDRVNHFRHENKDSCSTETHLHNLAKRYFYNHYTTALKDNKPVYLKQERQLHCTAYIDATEQPCSFEKDIISHDLTKYFNSCELEEAHGNFRPDVLLKSSKNEVIYIEVAVTHISEQSKIDSGNRIIEFIIESEDDLELLTQSLTISADNPKINFYNFKDAKPGKTDCGGQCTAWQFPVFLLHKSGKLQYTHLSPKGALSLQNNSKYQTYALCEKELVERSTTRTVNGYAYSFIVRKAMAQKLKIISCAACKDRRRAKFSDTGFYCKSKKKDVPINEAAKCEHYWPFESLEELNWYLNKNI